MTVDPVAGLTLGRRRSRLTFRRRLPVPPPAPAPEADLPRFRAAAAADMLPTVRVTATTENSRGC